MSKKYDIYELRQFKIYVRYINLKDISKALITEVVQDNSLTPKNYKEALLNPKWHEAMKDEHKALINNNTQFLVKSTSKMNIIGTKQVFKIKRKLDDSVKKYKVIVQV